MKSSMHRLRLPLAAALMLVFAFAFAGSASAATGFDPYTVEDTRTYDAQTDRTTFSYKVSLPDPKGNVHGVSHVDLQVCASYDPATIVDLGGGEYSNKPDGSIPTFPTPFVKWDFGTETTVTYTLVFAGNVPGNPTDFVIKASGDTFQGKVNGPACTPPPPPPGEEEPPPPNNEQPPNGDTPPQDNPIIPQPQQPQGEQDVLGDRVEPGTARIAGRSGCQRKAFKVSVRGTNIRKVVFTIDGKKVKAVRSSQNGKVYSITVNPNNYKAGSHVVTARVSFTSASNTRSKTLRARFARCVRTVAPAFTG